MNGMEGLIIHPFRGFGTVKFGIGTTQLKAQLGEPDKIELASEVPEEREIWKYDRIKANFAFDEDFENRLVNIITESEDAILFDEPGIINKNYHDVAQRLRLDCRGNISVHQLDPVLGWDLELIKHGIILKFFPTLNGQELEDCTLSYVFWAPKWSDEKDDFIWPE